ncbi:MAG: hypothetical protein PHU12_04755 [Candidatus Aenigmarchaeota archaeon]|nr:hypothetical protein [Candidatus Aenigmarchaeota archaeon]
MTMALWSGAGSHYIVDVKTNQPLETKPNGPLTSYEGIVRKVAPKENVRTFQLEAVYTQKDFRMSAKKTKDTLWAKPVRRIYDGKDFVDFYLPTELAISSKAPLKDGYYMYGFSMKDKCVGKLPLICAATITIPDEQGPFKDSRTELFSSEELKFVECGSFDRR